MIFIRNTSEGTLYAILLTVLKYFEIFSWSASTSTASGFDESYVISRNNKYGVFTKYFAARIEHRKSGRFVEIYSNQPGLHFYTGKD